MSAQIVYLDSTRTDVGTPLYDATVAALTPRRYTLLDRLFVAAFIAAVIGAVLLAVIKR